MASDDHPLLTLLEAELWGALFHRGHSALSIRNTADEFVVVSPGRDEPFRMSKAAALAAYEQGAHRAVIEEVVG